MTGFLERVGPVGYGAMLLSIDGRPERDEAIAVLQQALEEGVRLIDTADCYCLGEDDMHHNEGLIAEALESFSGDTSEIVVATKGGVVRPGGSWRPDGKPEHIRKTIHESAEILGMPIALWQHHAPDDAYPIEKSLEPVADAVSEGLIGQVGVSNYSVDQIERARKLVSIVSVQNQFNLWHRAPEQNGVLEYCTAEEITFLPWSPLGGRGHAGSLAEIKPLKKIAESHEVTPAQVVLAWMRQKYPVVLPIPGARSISHIRDAQESAELELEDSELRMIDSLSLS